MQTGYWESVRARRVRRRRLLAAGISGAAAASFLAACGGDSDEAPSTTGGATGTGTGATGATGATGTTGAASTGAPAGLALEPGALVYSKNFSNLPDETADAVEGGLKATMQNEDAAGTLDINLESSFDRDITEDVYEQLARLNLGPGVEYGSAEWGAPKPRLATGWEVSADALTYTFKMRKGVKFQNIDPVNGREMDMEDWRTSVEHFMEVSNVKLFLNDTIDRFETPDSETMVFHMKAPYGLFVDRGAEGLDTFSIMPKELNLDPDLAATKAIGTNFKILDEWQRDVSWNYSRFDDYWGGKPFIARWREAIVPEFANRRAQFLAQQTLRFVYSFFGDDQRDALQMRKDAPEAIMIGNPPPTTGFAIHRFGKQHTPESPWEDVRVRIGMRRAVNYDAITDFVAAKDLFNQAGIEIETTMSTHAPPDPRFWLDPREGELGEASENYLYNPEEAKKLFEAAGFGDGFDVTIYISDRGADSDPLALYIQEMEKFGLVRVQKEVLPWTDYFNTVLLNRSFDGIVSPGFLPATPPDYFLTRYVHSSGGNAPFPDPEMDAIVEKYRQQTDPVQQFEVLKEYQRLAATKFYSIPAHGWNTSWTFQWDWLHNPYNAGWPSPVESAHLEWLDADMPNRDG